MSLVSSDMDGNAPRRGGPGRSAFLAGVAVVVLVGVVAVASSGSVPSGGIRARRPSEGLVDAAFSLFLVGMVVAAVLVAVMLSFFGRQSADAPARRRRGPVRSVAIFMVAMALLAVIVRGLTGSEGRRLPSLAPAGGDGSATTDGAGSRYEPEFSLWPVLAVAALALVAGGAWWLSARGRRGARELQPSAPAEALADVLAATLDDLRSERDPRRAVIGAYARMERALSASGLPRSPSEAPEEYLDRVLGEVQVSRVAAARLTALFAWARFSGHDVRPEMKDEAIETLVRVQDELAAAEAARVAELAGVAA
jgi:hypothetical protein